MEKIRLTIIETSNEINSKKVGVPYEGDFVGAPQVGRQFYMANVSQGRRQSTNVFKTSPVIEILSSNTFKTENSIYRWEKV
jgi:hypothetical protein